MSRSARVPDRHRREHGQALVEFAVVMPVFVFMVFGLLEVGRLVYANSVLSQAAREGARVAAAEAGWIGVPGAGCVSDDSLIGSTNPGAHVCPADVSALETNVTAAANRMVTAIGTVDELYLSCNSGALDDPTPSGEWTHLGEDGGNGCRNSLGEAISSAGDLVSVRVAYTYVPFVPIVSSILEPIELSGSATMVIN